MPNAAARILPESRSAAMERLDLLRRVHDDLIAAIDAMDEATRQGSPNSPEYLRARWKLSQARRLRREQVMALYRHLSGRLDPPGTAALRTLQDEEMALLRRDAAHVMRWTTDKVSEDWPGFRRASGALRTTLRQLVATEKAVLYPLLVSNP